MTAITRNDVQVIFNEDVQGLEVAEQNYGRSWCKRGGAGAFMVIARKWDRIEEATIRAKPDPVTLTDLLTNDQRSEGIVDDIRDLRRYLLLVLMRQHQGPDYQIMRFKFHDFVVENIDIFADPTTIESCFEELCRCWGSVESRLESMHWDLFTPIRDVQNRVKDIVVELYVIEAMFRREYNLNPEHRDNAGETAPLTITVNGEVESAKQAAKIEKLRVFKDYVHRRLDERNIPKFELAECRIGKRLDHIFALLDEVGSPGPGYVNQDPPEQPPELTLEVIIKALENLSPHGLLVALLDYNEDGTMKSYRTTIEGDHVMNLGLHQLLGHQLQQMTQANIKATEI